MEGEDMGVLIGKRGQTLDSLQYLVSLVVNKDIDGYIHVKADTENYRERRKKTLENLAKNIAFKVKRTRQPVALEPMNPYERRIIHSALQDEKFITTYSEGEEPYRKVVVALKKDENGEEKTIEKTVAKKGYENHTFDRCFDETNPLWKRDGQYNFTFLKNTITQLNNELHAKRFMDLNTVYDALGFPKTQAGFQNGWVCKPGHELDTYIDIGIFDLNKETTREFVYGHNPTIWLTFNCKEIIWSDIPYEEV